MSDTPRTDAEACDGWTGDAVCVSVKFSRKLERELTAAQTEIARLKAGGCARNQRTTQFCAEALTLQEENAKLQERVKKRDKAMHALAAIIGPPGKQTWATDEQLNQAWELHIKAKDYQ